MAQTYPAIIVYALDPTGQPRIRATEIRLYTSSATDPVPVTGPDDGDLYFNTILHMWMSYDAARSKWLSFETSEIDFGRNGNTGNGAYYRGVDRRAFSPTIGRPAEFAGTVVSLSYTRSDTDAATFEVTAGGTGIATVASSAVAGTVTTLDGDFTSGQVLGVRNQTGGNTTSNVLGTVRVKWRIV